MTETPRQLAERIVRDLFTTGLGERATRLVLIDVNDRNLGGWSERAMTDRIARALGSSEPPRVEAGYRMTTQARENMSRAQRLRHARARRERRTE